VKRALAWFAGLAGIAALGRLLSQRSHHDGGVAEQPAGVNGDPADELRQKLAAQRHPQPEDPPAPVDETLEERRARVHARAREAIDSMHDDGPAA
jgi:hypothetical protein